MAVESTNISVVYAVTSAASGQEFSIPFPYIKKEHVIAYTVVDGETTNLTYGTDYTVSGTTLMVTGALTVGAKLIIYRMTPLTQEIVWVDGQAVYTPDIGQADDKLTYIAQEMKESLTRCVKVVPESGDSPENVMGAIYDARDDAAASASAANGGADRAQAWAESSTAPNAEDADSKSARTWAGEAERSASAALAAKNSVPNVTISTSEPTANDGVNGDVWFTYAAE